MNNLSHPTYRPYLHCLSNLKLANKFFELNCIIQILSGTLREPSRRTLSIHENWVRHYTVYYCHYKTIINYPSLLGIIEVLIEKFRTSPSIDSICGVQINNTTQNPRVPIFSLISRKSSTELDIS